MDHVSVLFVCMGNICRSPMADAYMRHLVKDAGIGDRVRVDSAGTHSYHLGHAPHDETQAELRRRGVDVGDQVSRLVTVADLETFDHVVAMDHANVAELEALAHQSPDPTSARARITLLLQHAEEIPGAQVDEVPDPYYVGGYDRVFDLVDAGCRGLLERIEGQLATEPG
ncbi:MAG: phosphotyrosine protein phosphatase [Thermoleophilia bacterium]|nr:phosphotyrosine protein phosphatase [Thermoleophilia bacterium]